MEISESPASPQPPPATASNAARRYWRANIAIMAVLLSIWALVSLGCGILFADSLNALQLPGTGYPLGFWFAQQGSIATFVVLIFVYCLALNRLDAKHLKELESERQRPAKTGNQGDAG
ncbi:MAG: DUF4212 domain-containing protein [Opitutales bacterium]